MGKVRVLRAHFPSSILRKRVPYAWAGIDHPSVPLRAVFDQWYSWALAAGPRLLRWTCGYNQPHQRGGLDWVICKHMGSDWARLSAECTEKPGQYGFLGRNISSSVCFYSAFESNICIEFQVLLDTAFSRSKTKKGHVQGFGPEKDQTGVANGSHIPFFCSNVWDIISGRITANLLGLQPWSYP